MYDQQMDSQDEWSRRIYNNRDLIEGGEWRRKRSRTIAVLRTFESSGREASENQGKEEFILGLSPRINFYPFSTHLTILVSYGLVRLLKKPSLRPSS